MAECLLPANKSDEADVTSHILGSN